MLIYRGVDFKKPALLWYLCQIFGGMILLYLKGQKKKQLYIGILRRKYQYPWEPIRIFMECPKGSVSNILWDDDGMFIQLYSREFR